MTLGDVVNNARKLLERRDVTVTEYQDTIHLLIDALTNRTRDDGEFRPIRRASRTTEVGALVQGRWNSRGVLWRVVEKHMGENIVTFNLESMHSSSVRYGVMPGDYMEVE